MFGLGTPELLIIFCCFSVQFILPMLIVLYFIKRKKDNDGTAD